MADEELKIIVITLLSSLITLGLAITVLFLIEKYKKRYIQVLYKDKDNAKENGCKWDQECKKWYTYNSNTAY
jgi:hypothetical protein